MLSAGIATSPFLWSGPYAVTPPGIYKLRLDDDSGQIALSANFSMLSAGTRTAATNGLQFTNPSFEGIVAGQPFNLTWAAANGPTILTLQNATTGDGLPGNTIGIQNVGPSVCKLCRSGETKKC